MAAARNSRQIRLRRSQHRPCRRRHPLRVRRPGEGPWRVLPHLPSGQGCGVGRPAAGAPTPRVVTFTEVAPVAMMLGSADLLRGWVRSTLAGLATDDDHHARLRETLLAFLQSGGSYKATAERLVLHKNSVQYRIRKAEESLGRPVAGHRHDIELALQATHWLG